MIMGLLENLIMIIDWVQWINIQPGQKSLSDLQNKKLDIFQQGLEQEIKGPVILSKNTRPDRLQAHIQRQQKVKRSYEQALTGSSEKVLEQLLDLIDITDMEIETAQKRLNH
jgi:ABC-type uncharacterized transport system ATPase subunit